MSTSIAERLVPDKRVFLGGAPRSRDLAGEVLIFESATDTLKTKEEWRLAGEILGSGFGYDTVVVDINKDG